MAKTKNQCETINLNGFRVDIFKDSVHVYMRKEIQEFDYKATEDRIITYLMDELFIERKNVKVEIKEYENTSN